MKEKPILYSHADYMAGKCTYREYFAQFAYIFKAAVRQQWSAKYLAEKLSQDKHLNNIPLCEWNRLSIIYKSDIAGRNKRLGNGCVWSLSVGVCAAKEAATQIAEEWMNQNEL